MRLLGHRAHDFGMILEAFRLLREQLFSTLVSRSERWRTRRGVTAVPIQIEYGDGTRFRDCEETTFALGSATGDTVAFLELYCEGKKHVIC
jgi:hypothetical protein